MVLQAVSLIAILSEFPQWWWESDAPAFRTTGDFGLQFRTVWIDLGPSWYGYVGAFVWLPVAIFKVVKAARRGVVTTLVDRILVYAVAALVAGTTLLVHLTPLRFTSVLIL
jgi:hypothetical protein